MTFQASLQLQILVLHIAEQKEIRYQDHVFMLPKIASFLFLLEDAAQIISKEVFYFSFHIILSINQKLCFESILTPCILG